MRYYTSHICRMTFRLRLRCIYSCDAYTRMSRVTYIYMRHISYTNALHMSHVWKTAFSVDGYAYIRVMHIHEWVMSHIYIYETYHLYKCATKRHTWEKQYSVYLKMHIFMWCIHMNDARHIHEWVMLYVCAYFYAVHTYEWYISHSWKIYAMYMCTGLCDVYIWMRHVTFMNE